MYCPDPWRRIRRTTRKVQVGPVTIGGDSPIVVQSMLTSDTRDTEACVKEALELAEAGCQIVRVTAQTRKIAENLESIVAGIRAGGSDVPVVADIHFKPDAALEAAKWVEKVRVNPGNFVDKKKFDVREYTDAQYAEELERIEEAFAPLVDLCLERGVAMRIGTNHGSLSDRIMNRYGDTPHGMVESALEFARIARDRGYHQFLFSMKASNPKVMIEAYRLLADRLDKEGPDWNYPLHLGVTEAGDGEDGRIKSAIGIGSLLLDGLGDTIRVSLTEDAIHEIPVARALLAACERDPRTELEPSQTRLGLPFDPFSYRRRPSQIVKIDKGEGNEPLQIGGDRTVAVLTSQKKWDALAHKLDKLGDFTPEATPSEASVFEIDPRDDAAVELLNTKAAPRLVALADGIDVPIVPGYRLLAAKVDPKHPILLKDVLHPSTDSEKEFLPTLLVAASNLGSLLCDGIGDAVLIQGEEAPGQSLRLAYNVLQAAGTRIFKTDYVACPSCGRTLFNLQTTTQKIREATGHLKGVRIAVMGCIVNGPGEMADADFGYVGGAPAKINLYVGKEAVEFNIPETEAVDRLVDLIKQHDRWVEAPVEAGEAS